MKSLLLFLAAIVVGLIGVARMQTEAGQGLPLVGVCLILFLIGAVVNHGEHMRPG
jgi:hypothetical protein